MALDGLFPAASEHFGRLAFHPVVLTGDWEAETLGR